MIAVERWVNRDIGAIGDAVIVTIGEQRCDSKFQSDGNTSDNRRPHMRRQILLGVVVAPHLDRAQVGAEVGVREAATRFDHDFTHRNRRDVGDIIAWKCGIGSPRHDQAI